MKTRRDKITPKNSVNSKINKIKHGHNTKKTWGLGSNVTIEKLDNLNEVIRVHKTQRAEGKGTWKLVPKDSCEIYKERRKRKLENEKRNEDNVRENESSVKTTGRKDLRRRQCNRKNTRRRPYSRRNNRKRIQPSDSSSISADCECDCNCESPSSTASTGRSSVTISDMDYD